MQVGSNWTACSSAMLDPDQGKTKNLRSTRIVGSCMYFTQVSRLRPEFALRYLGYANLVFSESESSLQLILDDLGLSEAALWNARFEPAIAPAIARLLKVAHTQHDCVMLQLVLNCQ